MMVILVLTLGLGQTKFQVKVVEEMTMMTCLQGTPQMHIWLVSFPSRLWVSSVGHRSMPMALHPPRLPWSSGRACWEAWRLSCSTACQEFPSLLFNLTLTTNSCVITIPVSEMRKLPSKGEKGLFQGHVQLDSSPSLLTEAQAQSMQLSFSSREERLAGIFRALPPSSLLSVYSLLTDSATQNSETLLVWRRIFWKMFLWRSF